jgi:tetratricopeptide (TPR) repeat protein
VKKISKHYNSGQIPDEQIKSLPSENDVLFDLSRQAITEFIDTIKPRLTEVRRPVKNGVGYIEEGRIYALDNLWKEAIDSWFKAVQISPNEADIHYNIGLAHEALGEYEKAEEYYRRAQLILDDKLYQDALDNIAEAREKKKKKLIELLEKYPPANFLKQKETEDTEKPKGRKQSG